MIDIILLQGKVLLRKEILQNDDKKQTLPSRGAPGAGNEAAERVGDGPRFFGVICFFSWPKPQLSV